MKLSEKTLVILKNFLKINRGIVINEGNILMTKSDDANIYAEAKIDETIADEFAIYDLNEFINYLSLVGQDSDIDPNIEDLKLYIKGVTGKKGTMNLADPSVVTHPKKRIAVLVADVTFELKSTQIEDIQNAASISGHNMLCFTPREYEGEVYIFADILDPKDSSANIVSIPIQKYTDGAEFKFFVNIDNLKMIKSDYKVEVSKIGAITFINDSVKYVIALDSQSTYTA